jgi:hypothetical protein
MSPLSLLTVTRGEPFARPFLTHFQKVAEACDAELVIVADGPDAAETVTQWGLPISLVVESRGYIESVLDAALIACTRDYVLRMDDDETCSPAMIAWLADGGYLTSSHWKFPRPHLWQDTEHFLDHPQLWPDHQTRLSVRSKSGGRRQVHAGSPFGSGRAAPVSIYHHKFLVKTQAERQAIADRYDRVQRGFGTGGMLAFSLPELAISHPTVAPISEAEIWAIRDSE